MTPELHLKAKQLFLAVCELDEQVRREYLDQQCAGDPALREEVESLLKYHITDTLIAPQVVKTPRLGEGTGNVGRWQPGSMVAGRYRIIHQLGKGGMGEVYRAEDTFLSREVALKFITAGRGTDPVWLSQFYAEARTASTITHRHICRVYDIGEADGEAFISMEYIDGENLAALLRRVNRITPEKAAELSRQLCIGLAAIHERGILHRDLKPANVMIDGRGEVRITDFGIAVDLQAGQLGRCAGTPRYMAPELTQGDPATVQSDLYALGLILYEMVTGRNAFGPDVTTINEPAPSPSPPTEWSPGLNSSFEQIILRCLEPDPDHRPRSAFDVLTGIPGGEILNSIVAAGETPPVEMVARSHTKSRWDYLITMTSSLIAIAGLIAVLLLANKTMLVSYAGLSQPPEVLADRAKQMLAYFGYDPSQYRQDAHFYIHEQRWETIRELKAKWPIREARISPGKEVICFHYALLSVSESPTADLGIIELKAPAVPVAQVVLDGQGYLREFESRTLPSASSADPKTAVDWSKVFQSAGLEWRNSREITPPPAMSTGRGTARAWETVSLGTRVEGKERGGQLLQIKVTPSSPELPTGSRATRHRLMMRMFFLITLAVMLPMSWHNLMRHKGDRNGAFRLAFLVFVMNFSFFSARGIIPASITDAFAWLVSGMQTALLSAFLVWLYYIALEPYIRRFWPHALISWTRVLTGRLRDPLVGRDMALGCLFGVGMILIMQVTAWIGLHSRRPYAGLVAPVLDWDLGRLSGYGFTIGSLTSSGIIAIGRAFIAFAFMLSLRLLTKRKWAAALLFFIILATAYLFGARPLIAAEYVEWVLLSLMVTLVLDRAGVLAFVVMLFVKRLLITAPLTLDMNVWFAGQSILTATIIASILVFAYFSAKPTPRESI